ncbi:MAG TPA: FliM/FliN family flagellar motor C-terminal domain-containing protein [Acidisarcina sp.]
MSTAPLMTDAAPRGPQLVEMRPADDRLDAFGWLPCTVTIDLQLVNFTIGNLLKLKLGTVVETACNQTRDLPLRVNGRLMGWTEFEVVGDRLAVRLTDLA